MNTTVVTLGEALLRLSPPAPQRIEQAAALEMHLAGSECNVAVGLARLGVGVTWWSRLTNNVLGQHIVRQLRAQGVDVTQICWTEQDRIGLYFYEAGSAPRSAHVCYDRAHSAMSRVQPSDLPTDGFLPQSARLLHVSGITSALSASAAATNRAAVERAKAAGWLVSCDVNYRALLWSPLAAATECEQLAAQADILFIAMRDAITLYNTSAIPEIALQQIQNRFPRACIVLTLGAAGAAGIAPGGMIAQQPAFPSSEQGRLGRGDAFVAGFLYAHLQGSALAGALAWGNAAAAYKSSLAGDLPLLDPTEIAHLVAHQEGKTMLR